MWGTSLSLPVLHDFIFFAVQQSADPGSRWGSPSPWPVRQEILSQILLVPGNKTCNISLDVSKGVFVKKNNLQGSEIHPFEALQVVLSEIYVIFMDLLSSFCKVVLCQQNLRILQRPTHPNSIRSLIADRMLAVFHLRNQHTFTQPSNFFKYSIKTGASSGCSTFREKNAKQWRLTKESLHLWNIETSSFYLSFSHPCKSYQTC